VKVLSCSGSGTFSDIAAGVEYVADRGWDVASMSLGGSSDSQTLRDAVQYAYDSGVFLAAAAGSCSTCSSYPADYPEVASVGATNENNGVLSTSSTSVDIFAPGESIYSTVPAGYKTYSGTSMATPHVAAAAGILIAQRGYSNTNVLTRLRNTAQPVTNCSGCGLLDVRAAVNC
jgi:subtilisin